MYREYDHRGAESLRGHARDHSYGKFLIKLSLSLSLSLSHARSLTLWTAAGLDIIPVSEKFPKRSFSTPSRLPVPLVVCSREDVRSCVCWADASRTFTPQPHPSSHVTSGTPGALTGDLYPLQAPRSGL